MMHPAIELRVEGPRGCGYRKPGGVYIMNDAGATMPCRKLPIPLCPCERCRRGIKATRGWQWISPDVLLDDAGDGYRPDDTCARAADVGPAHSCHRCPLHFEFHDNARNAPAGLIWAGEEHYPTPEDWMREAIQLGASRRLHTVPRGFRVGETWVWMAHRKAVEYAGADGPAPGVFHLFRPTRIERVVDEDTTAEEIEAWVEHGITPVIIERRANWAHAGILEDFTPPKGRKATEDDEEDDE